MCNNVKKYLVSIYLVLYLQAQYCVDKEAGSMEVYIRCPSFELR